MGSTNFGTQTLRFDFRQDATGETFNQINYKLTPIGIYEGGLLTRVSDVAVNIAPLECFIYDDTNELGLRISTAATQALTVSTSNIYVVLRFDWLDSENNYMDMLAIPYASLQADDLILGRCIFDGSTLDTVFDYSRRDDASLQKLENRRDDFKVFPVEPISNLVSINEGVFRNSNGYVTVATANSPVISDTTLGRIDLIYINETGTISVLEGVDSGSPVEPSYDSKGLVIAKVNRGASRTNIRGNEIIQLYDVFTALNLDSPMIPIYKGYMNLSMTNIDSTSEPTFTGSVDVNGTLVTLAAESGTGFSGLATSSDVWVYVESDGDVVYSASVPAWDSAKGGWYNSNDRAVVWMRKDSGDAYRYKHFVPTEQSAEILFEEIIAIGNWNMSGVSSITVNHELGSGAQSIRTWQATIRNDAADVLTDLNYFTNTPTFGGSINIGSAARFNLSRVASGAFDNASHDDPAFDRGWIIFKHKVL